MSAIEDFVRIARAATDRLAATANAPDVIAFGASALELIAAHPEERPEFARRLLAGLSDDDFDVWFIQFCAHGLRWAELKAGFESISRRAIADNDWRLIAVAGKVLEAFEDDWEDAEDFYSAYFGARPRR